MFNKIFGTRLFFLTTAVVSSLAFGTAAQACNLAGKSPRPMSSAALMASPLAQNLATPESAEFDSHGSIVGLWIGNLLYQGQVVAQGFDMFHIDRTELLVTNTSPVEENVCPGVWEQTGPSTYKLNHPSWLFDSNGNLIGTAVILEKLTLSRDGNSFTGTYNETDYDTSGNVTAQFQGTIKATRIKVNSSALSEQ